MHIDICVVGVLETNCYIVDDEDGACVVIDRGDQLERIMASLAGRTPDAILVTHQHHDHVGALAALARESGAPIYAGSLDAPYLEDPSLCNSLFPSLPEKVAVDYPLNDGDVVSIGKLTFKVLHTPGHTCGSVCFYDEGNKLLLSGDTLFYRNFGRTDFDTGNAEQMSRSLHRLALLPDDTQVFAGHGPSTTIGQEKQFGPLREMRGKVE